MHPMTGVGMAVAAGVALGPWLGGGAGWWGAASASLLAALPFRGLLGPRGLLAGLLLGVAAVQSLPRGPVLRGEVVLVGRRVGAATGRTADLEVGMVKEAHGWRPARGRVRVDFPGAAPPAGTELLVWGRGLGGSRPSLPGAPDAARATARVGVRTRLQARSVRVLGPAEAPWRPPSDPTGMLAALALGDRSGVAPETTAILRGTGTSHLLAISGFHVGVVAGMGVAVGGVFRRALGLIVPGGTRPWEWLLGLMLAVSYTLVAGAPISAQRAAGLVGLMALARLGGRRAEAEPLLGWVAIGVLLIDPGAIDTPSFQLSFGAVLGLVRVGGPLAARWPWPRLAWMGHGLSATVGATLGTLPAGAWWFQELAPLSPLANLYALPITSVVLVPAAGVACFGPEPLASLADTVGSLAARWMLWALQPLAVAPFRPAVGPLGALGLGLALLLAHRPALSALIAALCLGLRPLPRADTFTFLSVGQGDATLFEGADGRRILIDGGPHPDAVAAWLRRRGLRRIDVVVATHNQRDHIGGLLGVLGSVRVGRLEVSDHAGLGAVQVAAERAGVPIVPARGLHPPADFEGGPNDRSVVLGLGPVLLTGDIEAAGERALADRVPPFPVLKVPHHGSTTSSSPALLDAVDPQVAVVSVGAGNPWGHPRAVVLARYAERGIQVLRTDRHGTLVLRDGRWWGHRPGAGWTELTGGR